MSVGTKHPAWNKKQNSWRTMRDTYEGEEAVKEGGTLYLPATSGMIADGFGAADSAGTKAYNAYRMRAHFPSVMDDAVSAMLGVMHHKPPMIELPPELESMRRDATLRHESLAGLLARINEEQLVMGRVGMMLDLPPNPIPERPDIPYIASYTAENIINWDEGRRDGIVVDNLSLLVLDETSLERSSDFEWETKKKYRVLSLRPDLENEPSGRGVYHVGVFQEDGGGSFTQSNMVAPHVKGRTLNKIPFVFANSKDIVPEPDHPPLLGLANLALTIYRGEADYRQGLFMQGQDTFVVIGASEDEFRLGANSVVALPIGGDAKFVGVESDGLKEQREALQNDRLLAASKGGQMIDNVSRERESGDALQIRVSARTATLKTVAKSGAYALETLLKYAAEWVGANPELVKVTPNLDFSGDKLGGRELVEMMTAKSMGAPYSIKSIHNQMRLRDMTELTFDEELAEIDGEPELAGFGSLNQDGPVDDDDERDDN